MTDLIRGLAGCAKQRRAALDELLTNIWHQGTIYEASPTLFRS